VETPTADESPLRVPSRPFQYLRRHEEVGGADGQHRQPNRLVFDDEKGDSHDDGGRHSGHSPAEERIAEQVCRLRHVTLFGHGRIPAPACFSSGNSADGARTHNFVEILGR